MESQANRDFLGEIANTASALPKTGQPRGAPKNCWPIGKWPFGEFDTSLERIVRIEDDAPGAVGSDSGTPLFAGPPATIAVPARVYEILGRWTALR